MTEQPPFWGSVIATALISAVSGYYLSTILNLNEHLKRFAASSDAQESSSDYVDVDEDEMGPVPSNALPTSSEEHKMVLVVRSDLGMGKGKVAAQCGHATLACYKRARRIMPSNIKTWESHGQAKIALKCASEDDLLLLQATAISLGLVAEIIHDAGRTQIAAGSATVLGIGPGPKSLVNQVTGHLSLL